MPRPAKTAEGVTAQRGQSASRSYVIPPSRPLPAIAVALGILWATPNTVIGLFLGVLGMLFGARPQLRTRDLACVFHRWPWGPGGALTLGNVILHTGNDLDVPCATYSHAAGLGDEPAVSLALHERAHVYQYLVLGPLFLPVYLLCGGVGVRNRFERAADRYAGTGRGWWPWPAPPMPARVAPTSGPH